jgi:hypothetical protein
MLRRAAGGGRNPQSNGFFCPDKVAEWYFPTRIVARG